MDYIEVNDQLKTLITELIDIGYKKTAIGKLLLGSSSYAPMLKYTDHDGSENLNFGIKPLTKIGSTLNYNLKLVFVKDDNEDIVQEIENMNSAFFIELKRAIVDYMESDNKPAPKKRTLQFETALNEIFYNDILKEDNEDSNE